jgi:hypothetical protein
MLKGSNSNENSSVRECTGRNFDSPSSVVGYMPPNPNKINGTRRSPARVTMHGNFRVVLKGAEVGM